MTSISLSPTFTFRVLPLLMKFFSNTLSRAGSISSPTSSISSGLPNERLSSRWFRKYLWLREVTCCQNIQFQRSAIPHEIVCYKIKATKPRCPRNYSTWWPISKLISKAKMHVVKQNRQLGRIIKTERTGSKVYGWNKPSKIFNFTVHRTLYMHGTTNTNIAGPATTHLHLTVLFSVFNPGFSLTLRIYQQRIPCCLGDNNAILDR